LSLGLGEAQWRAGEIADARETFKIVADAAARSGNREHAARAALGYGGAMRPAVGLVDQDLVALLNAALEMLGTEESGLKARAMARLAIELYYSDRKEERVRLGRAAAEMARRGGDPATLAYCLNGLHYALWGPEFLDEQMSSATEVLQIAEEIGDPDLVLRGHFWRMGHFLEAGDIAAADRELEACVALSERLRQPFYKEWATRFRAMRAAFAGRFDESERLALEALAIGQRVGDTEALGLFGLQLFLLRRLQGRLAELEEPVRTYVEQYPAIPGWRSGLACLYSDIDRDAEARREFEVLAQRGFAGIPHDHTWLPAMNFAAETCRFLGDDQRAGQLYEQLLPYENRQIVVGGGIGYYGPVTRPLALLAETAGRTDDALRHFAAAERAAAAMGATAWLEQVRFEAARARLERDPDDAEAGLAIDECLANARSLGMARLEELITRMKLPQSIASSTPRTATLTREGEYWSVSFSGAVFRLHDAKGLHHMSKLVQRPGSEVHVLELAGGLGSSDRTSAREAEEAGLSMGADDAGDLLDPAAKAAYKRRLDDLEAELQEAEEFNDSGRAASAKAEIEFLARELSSALGLTGRSRKSASSAERARLTVTKAIRSAVKKVAENDPALGRHLEARLKTGTYCSYQPDPDSPVTWNVTS
jgi:tetratricopeptide (TPR) repeat protein